MTPAEEDDDDARRYTSAGLRIDGGSSRQWRRLSSVKHVNWWIRKNVIIANRERSFYFSHSFSYADAANNFADGCSCESERWRISFSFYVVSFFFPPWFLCGPTPSFDLCAAIVTAHSAVDHAPADIFRVVELSKNCVCFPLKGFPPFPVVPSPMDWRWLNITRSWVSFVRPSWSLDGEPFHHSTPVWNLPKFFSYIFFYYWFLCVPSSTLGVRKSVKTYKKNISFFPYRFFE
jgi:hypothetical protein